MKKRHRRKESVYTDLLLAVLLSWILVDAAILLVGSVRPLYGLCLRVYHIPERAKMSFDACMNNYGVLMDYMLPWGPRVLRFPDFRMSSHGEIHFQEVKRIFLFFQYSFPVSILLFTLVRILAARQIHAEYLKYSLMILVSAVGITGAGLLINANGFIILLHKMLFTNNYWIFDQVLDPVITILPPSVFITAGAGILLLLLSGSFGIFLLYRRRKRKYTKN